MKCTNVVTIGAYSGAKWSPGGSGGGGRWILFHSCRACGAVHRVVKNWHGSAPRGGFVCGREEDKS